MNLIDVSRALATDEQCLAFLEHQRWPDGIVRCPTCGNDKISKITRKTATKNKRAQVYQCLEPTCKGQFSATNGTIFHDSHLPLHKWFMAIALVIDAKKGISAKQLQNHLGIGSYKTAWYMCHRIREAMVETNPTPLTGVVEIDETYIGGTAIRRFQKNPKPRAPKDVVLAMRERGTKEKPGRVRFFHVPNAKLETLKPIIEANLQVYPERVVTDSAPVYDIMFSKGPAKKAHRMVNHSQEWVVPGTSIRTNTVESSFSLLKRGLIGSFHRVSIKHLHRYLTEFEFRFNERRNAERFEKTVSEMLQTKPMPMMNLLASGFVKRWRI
jgi:transposase-like protein